MSRMSDMLNEKKKFVITKTNNREEDLNQAFGRLRGLIESGLIDLANGLADEIEKNSEETVKVAVDDAVENACKECEEFEENAKKAGWCCKSSKKEMVDHPSHYQGKRFEVIDIIEDYDLGFNLGNAIKYILRAGHKDGYEQDLKKAIWYLEREISSDKNISKGL